MSAQLQGPAAGGSTAAAAAAALPSAARYFVLARALAGLYAITHVLRRHPVSLYPGAESC